MNRSFTYLLIAIHLLSLVSSNYWSKWTRWSECSRTCDGGATFQTRRCIRSRVYNFGCKGSAIRYSTCNNKPCPSGLPDFRSQQCAAYNDVPYSGRYFRWLAYHDPNDPCALSCLAEGTKMVAILAPKVLDGTRCDTHTLDMCINGKCMRVGCDHMLNSKVKMDSCGVCGGNESCVHGNRGNAGRYRWIETGFGSCSVTCGVDKKIRESTQSNTRKKYIFRGHYISDIQSLAIPPRIHVEVGQREKKLLCFDAYLGKVMDSTFCENLIRPTETKQKCSMGSCPPEWRVGPWQNCTRDCGGGVSWRIVTCVKTFEDGTQQWVRGNFCNSLRPSSRKSCNGHICPTWYAGEWSVCSVSCGTGQQRREVVCRHVGDTFCRDAEKPKTVKNCTTGIPCFGLNDPRFIGRGFIGDIQENIVGQFQAGSEIPVNDQALTKDDLSQPRYVYTSWDSCSATCGEGVRFRFVRCQVFLKYLNDFVDLPDTDCEEEKPPEYSSCFLEPCYDQYEWVAVGMTKCSQSCLGGIQETILKCALKSNGSYVPEDYCVEAPHIQTERRVCNDKPCPQRWELGPFGACNSSCGGGMRNRTVKCVQEYAQGPQILNLPDIMCAQPTPPRQERCNVHDCPAKWAVGNWSECSVTCGLGIIKRAPFCQRIKKNGRLERVFNSECDITLRPETERMCNLTACPEPMIKTKDVRFYQLNKMSKVKLVVGMRAFLLPETSVVVKCPHVGLDRQKVYWFKNGRKVKRLKRTRVTRSGALRIRQARPEKDDGVYSCLIGGLESNLTINFSSSFDVLQATMNREKFIQGVISPEDNAMNGSHLHLDPVDRNHKPLNLLSTDWTLCTVTCGGGLQSRNMSCEIITRNYYEVFPMSICTKFLDKKPLMIRSCRTEPCVRWRSGNWSRCSDDQCVRDFYSIQKRSVMCSLQFNETQLNETFCKSLGFPPDNVRDCYNPNCIARWNTSSWSKCVSECDSTGFKTRMLSCVWTTTGRLAPQGSCDTLPVPRTTRKCKGTPCSSIGMHTCEDETDYCSIVKLLKMCHFSNFPERCCFTCSEDYYYDAEESEVDADVIDS